MNNSEKELNALIKNSTSKENGFKIFIETYQKQVYGLIRRMVIIHEDADNLTQNTFIKAFRHIEKFEGNSSIATWLYKIAYNESLTFLYWKKRKQFFYLEDCQAEMINHLTNREIDGEEISDPA